MKPDGGPEGSRMDADAWTRVQEIFHDALDVEPFARAAFVRAACSSRPELFDPVMGLLEEDGREAGLLDRGLGSVADDVLGADASLPSIGRYRTERVLGRGGMGVVYLAERPDLGLSVAVKVLRDAAFSPARRERFLSEQRTLAHLIHPRIARLYDADVLPDGTPYFVMEYVTGDHLDVWCARRRASVRARLELFQAICDAVRFAHGRAIIHRDLKPSNIMVTEEGEPKLLDFGIAKHLDETDVADPTRTGLRMMTPAYAAPEQLLGEPLGVYTDVYALGVILYELLTGQPPYDLSSLSPASAERVVLAGDTAAPSSRAARRTAAAASPPAPTSVTPGTPPSDATELSRSAWRDLDVLCATAMHRDPGRRYASVEALMRDVGHYLSGTPLEARPDSRRYRLSKFARRNARGLGFAAAALSALVVTAAFYTWRLADARDAAVLEAQRTRRIQEFTQDLFRGGDEVAGPADTLRVLTLLERGVQQARLLAADPGPQSEMYLTLGSIYAQLGQFERADSLLGVALDLRQALEPVDAVAVAEVQGARAELRVQQGEYVEAERLLSEVLATRRTQRPRDDAAIAAALAALGIALEGRGEYDGSVAALDEAIALYERQGEAGVELSAALAALATTYFYAGELDRADSLNLRTMEIDRRLHGPRHPSIADALINLAAAQAQRGQYAQGEPMLREAVSIFEGYHGPDHPETASAIRMLGSNVIFQGRLEEGAQLAERALAIQERTLSPDHPRLANTMGDLAFTRLRSGRYDEAVELYRRIVEIYRTTNGERHYFVAIGLSNLAAALMEGGRLGEAEAMFRDVVDRFAESRGPDHLDTGIARIKLGRVLLRAGDARAAEPELLAGYDIVKAQAAPTVSWLTSARTDLAAAYERLGLPVQAARFRKEQAAADSAATRS